MSSAWALKPIDGIIMGKVSDQEQIDPLSEYFSQDENIKDEENSLKLAFEVFEGKELERSCKSSKKLSFSTNAKEQSAMRAIVASSQFIVLDRVIRNIARLAKTVSMSSDDYNQLTENLVQNFCSQNITVYGHRLMKNNLKSLYHSSSKLDYFEKIPVSLKKGINKKEFYNKSLASNIYLFRTFCSWGGDIKKLGLLNNYLRDPIFMNSLFRMMRGIKVSWNIEEQKYQKIQTKGIGVLCDSLVCRHSSFDLFKRRLPFALGAFDLKSNLDNLYCHYLKEASDGVAHLKGNMKKWHKEEAIFSDVTLKAELIALISNTPNYLNLLSKKNTFDEMMTSRYRAALSKWSEKRLHKLSRELFFEESLEISSRTDFIADLAAKKKMSIDLVLGLGEIDHQVKSIDKLNAYFDIQFTESFFAWIKMKLERINPDKPSYEQEKFMHQLESKIKVYLKAHSKDFIISPFAENLEKVIARDLISWTDKIPKEKLNRTSQEMIHVTVNMRYGLFALKYFYDRFQVQYR